MRFDQKHYENSDCMILSDDEILKSPDYLYRAKWIEERIKPNSILELGCHTGILSLRYAYIGWRVVGVDLNVKAIDFCNGFLSKFGVTTSDYFYSLAEDFDSEERFDNVILSEVIEHVEDPVILLEVAEKHLKEDGQIFITTPDEFGPFGKENTGDIDHEHLRLYNEDSLKELISNRGIITDFKSRQLLYISYSLNK